MAGRTAARGAVPCSRAEVGRAGRLPVLACAGRVFTCTSRTGTEVDTGPSRCLVVCCRGEFSSDARGKRSPRGSSGVGSGGPASLTSVGSCQLAALGLGPFLGSGFWPS